MHILLTGGTGLIGSTLAKRLLALQHTLTILTRNPDNARHRLGDVITYHSTLDDLTSLDGIDAVINLAGEPIAHKRWTPKQKERLCQSRWQITQHLSKLITCSAVPPHTFISGSAVGYYGDQGENIVTEEETPHDEFTHQLCARWESLAQKAASKQTRVCLLRTGMVLAAHGGALAKMLPLFRLGLGGRLGSGRQYVPWIHLDDMVNAIIYLLTTPDLQGPFNITAPYPAHNEQFTAALGKALHRPTWLHTPAVVIRLLMGESSVLVLGSQRAIPKRLEEAGFGFRYFELEEALRDITSALN